jgi:hypothetical protein
VSGGNALGVTLDEEAKMRDKSHHVNPSTEVLSSAIQMFRARPGVKGIRCSSAWQTEGSHYLTILEGSTESNHVARIGELFVDEAKRGFREVADWDDKAGRHDVARLLREWAETLTADHPNVPTWVANPSIGALASRLESDAAPAAVEDGGLPKWKIWMRENGSVPMKSGSIASATLEELRALVQANQSNQARAMAHTDRGRKEGNLTGSGLQTFEGLPSWDPRSKGWRGNGGSDEF